MEWGPIITGALSIIGLLLKAWFDGAPKRKTEAADAAIQQGRKDIVDGNVDAVSERLDRLLSVDQLPGDSAAGKPDSEAPDKSAGAV